MPKFIIEREIPDAGKLSEQDLRAVARKSSSILRQMSPGIQWVQSYVTSDKLYCVYIATDEEEIREHARRGGFPVDRISRVVEIIDPSTSEARVA